MMDVIGCKMLKLEIALIYYLRMTAILHLAAGNMVAYNGDGGIIGVILMDMNV